MSLYNKSKVYLFNFIASKYNFHKLDKLPLYTILSSKNFILQQPNVITDISDENTKYSSGLNTIIHNNHHIRYNQYYNFIFSEPKYLTNRIITGDHIYSVKLHKDANILKHSDDNTYFTNKLLLGTVDSYPLFDKYSIDKFGFPINDNYLKAVLENNSVPGLEICLDHKIIPPQQAVMFAIYNSRLDILKFLHSKNLFKITAEEYYYWEVQGPGDSYIDDQTREFLKTIDPKF
jgi:hypothetical protein